MESIRAKQGTPVKKPENPTKDGVYFFGWFDAADGVNEYGWPHTLNADVEMHAQWTATPPYTISFKNHEDPEVKDVKAQEGTAVKKPADPKRKGYGFLGWFSQEKGGDPYEDAYWPHTLTGDVYHIDMYAHWELDPPYGIKYELDEGINDDRNPETYTVEDLPITLYNPTRSGGFRFGGWYEDDGFPDPAITEIPEDSTGAKKFYAQWVPITVTSVTVDPPTASVDKGGTQQFSATVAGTGDPDQEVDWTVEDGGAGTTIDDDGFLTVNANETAGTLTVTATSKFDTSKSGTAEVTVTTPITVTVSPATAVVVKGGTKTFTATVEGTGNPAQTVDWTVNSTAGTTIIGGVLNVASGETATTLTVTATSTVDGTKYGEATVTLPAHTDMVQAASAAVPIEGNSAYYYNSSYDYNKGVFILGRTVTLSPFSIAKYETTYELWYTVRQWAQSNGYNIANPGWEGRNESDGNPPTAAKYEPVTYINWRDAVVWCNAYSEMSGKEAVYYTDTSYNTVLRVSTNDDGTGTDADKAVMKPGVNGYRLPTEAEWEYAARGGGTPSTTGTFADKWAGTNGESYLKDYAWYSGNSGNTTYQVGLKTANGLGLYDMSGNVYEWCWDWYGTVGTGTVTDPEGLGSGTGRVFRGGSWYIYASNCAVAYRNGYKPSIRNDYLGFRLVLCP